MLTTRCRILAPKDKVGGIARGKSLVLMETALLLLTLSSIF